MKRIRVLVVDDSAVIRRLLTEVLSADNEIEVVGTAPNASLAMARIKESSPDIITLDVEMPGMSGIDMLVDLRKLYPRLPVIMFSSLTQRAAAITLEGLARGATDYVTKPANTGSLQASIEQVRDQLIPKIKVLSGNRPAVQTLPAAPVVPRVSTSKLVHQPPQVVLIGSSTGGPNALADVFAKIPSPLPVPVLITQHMPPLFTQMLAQRLDGLSCMNVREAKEGDVLQPGVAYIAPGDYHMQFVKQANQVVIRLDQESPENSCRPSVDVMMRSAAAIWGGRSLAVILTGMGQDGLKGCELLNSLGGQVFAQDEPSSVVWGMPGFVAKAGLAHRVLPLQEIAREIVARFPAVRGAVPGVSAPPIRESKHGR